MNTSTRILLVACALLSAPLAARAAQPSVPTKLPYQGVLLDAGGTPRTGPVDLTLRIYDGASGGALVYKQVFLGVPLTDGVFTVNLGPTGSATDAPSNPLTTTLASVFSSEVGASGLDRFLEITVGAEGALARTQILTAPFALRSANADSAANVTGGGTVAGVSSDFIAQLYQFGDSDGAGLVNSDPLEGFVDTDGDSKQNFIDPDNDDDGILDGVEAANGTAPNLVTPGVTSVNPTSGFALGATTVTVTGTSFQAGQSVLFGTQSPAPSGLTSTSFLVVVGPQPVATVQPRVTLANGQQSAVGPTFSFTTGALAHAVPANVDTQIQLRASGFAAFAISGAGTYGASPLGTDGAPTLVQSFPSEGGSEGQIATGWNAAGHLVGLRCRNTATDTCNIELSIDANDDRVFQAGEATIVEAGLTGSGGTAPRLFSPDIALDPSGKLVLGYVKRRTGGPSHVAVVAHDLDGNGSISGGERVEIEGYALSYPGAGALAVDASGRVAYVFSALVASNNIVRLAYDRNGDNDFLDANEVVTVASTSSAFGVPCLGVGFDPSGRVGVGYSGTFVRLARDLNGDGDFVDASEDQFIGGGSGSQCDVVGGGPLALAYSAGAAAILRLAVDRNNDGDVADLNEDVQVPTTGFVSTARVAAARLGGGTVAVGWAAGAGGQIAIDPNP